MIIIHKPMLLIIEDDMWIRSAMDVLFKDKYHIIHTNTAETGLTLIHNFQLDVVLAVDTLGGNLSGLGLLKVLRYEGNNTPVIIVSDKNIQKAADYWGARKFILKPFAGEEIHLAVTRVIESKKATETKTGPVMSLQMKMD
ncbi:MAG: response regulator [bacterium]